MARILRHILQLVFIGVLVPYAVLCVETKANSKSKDTSSDGDKLLPLPLPSPGPVKVVPCGAPCGGTPPPVVTPPNCGNPPPVVPPVVPPPTCGNPPPVLPPVVPPPTTCPCLPLPKNFCDQAPTNRLHRYYNAAVKDHFYTINWAELGNGKDGWVYEGVAGRCYATPQEGTIPLFRYWNPTAGSQDHFYTESWSEIGAGQYGYKLEGVACYISPVPRLGTLPLFRYWSSSRTDHFYTTNFAELGAAGLPSSFVSERIPGFVCPVIAGDTPVTPCPGSLE